MPVPADRRLEWEDVGDVTVVRFLTGPIRDEDVILAVFDDLDRLVGDRGRVNLVLTFTGVDGIASYAIGKLVSLNKRVRAAGGRIALCHVTPAVAEILAIMHLRGLFLIHPTEPEAIQVFA